MTNIAAALDRIQAGRHPAAMIPVFASPMDIALREARAAVELGEVPVGAVLVDGITGDILAWAHNRVESQHDPTAHAEMLALQAAARRLGQKRLVSADIYVTLEPCAMCAAALSLARVRRVYFGAYDPKGGGVDHGARIFQQPTCHHRPDVFGGIEESQCAALLKSFFSQRRGAQSGTEAPDERM